MMNMLVPYSSQTAVFMGCNKGEIELGFLNMSQVRNHMSYEMSLTKRGMNQCCIIN